jgi:hypothetical protein
MINKIKNFFLRLCSFFYSKSNESEYEKRYSKITCTYKIPTFVDNVQEKTNNENIVSEFKQDSVKNTLKSFKDFDTDNKWVSGRKKTKKLN